MIVPVIILLISLLILTKSSNMSVKYSVKLSKLTGIGKLAIGFLLISIITTLPEMTVAVTSGMTGDALVSVGNLLGTAVVNFCLVFGVIFLLTSVMIKKEDYKELLRAISVITIATLILLIFKELNFLMGLFFIFIFAAFFYSIYRSDYAIKIHKTRYKEEHKEKHDSIKTVEILKTLFYAIVSIIIVVMSAKFATDSAITLSQLLSVPESLVGATIIAVGTSLPELAIAIAAVRKNNISLAIGDLIGATTLDMTLILGVTSMFGTVTFGPITSFLITFILFSNMIFLFLISTRRCSKLHGVILLATFATFIVSLLLYQAFFL